MSKYAYIIAAVVLATAAFLTLAKAYVSKCEEAELLNERLNQAHYVIEELNNNIRKIGESLMRRELELKKVEKKLHDNQKRNKEIAGSDPQIKAVLDSAVPDAVLHGLRSFKARPSSSGKNKGAGDFAPAP